MVSKLLIRSRIQIHLLPPYLMNSVTYRIIKIILPPKKNNLCRSPYIYLLYKTQREMKETLFFSVEEPMFSFSTLIYTLKLCFEVLLPFINHPKTFKMHRISINNQPGKWKCPNNFGSHNDSFVT